MKKIFAAIASLASLVLTAGAGAQWG